MINFLLIGLLIILVIQMFVSIATKHKLHQSNLLFIDACINARRKITSIPVQIFGNGKIPEFKTDGAVGADCYANIENPITIQKGTSALINLGFGLKVPYGYKAEILPRSGLSKDVISITGEIDQDYTGEVKARLWNVGEDYTVNPGDRICQIEIIPIVKPSFYEVYKLDETSRGNNGFGSTGK